MATWRDALLESGLRGQGRHVDDHAPSRTAPLAPAGPGPGRAAPEGP